MKVEVTIEGDPGGELSLGISADGLDPLDVFKLLVAGAESVAYQHVADEMIAHGAEQIEAAYAAPLRTRLFVYEQLSGLELQPYRWIALDLDAVED